jgi:hypothetical protein
VEHRDHPIGYDVSVSAVGRNDVNIEAMFAEFWGMSRDRKAWPYEDLGYVASDREGVCLLPLPTSGVEALKRLLHQCRVLCRQNHLENRFAAKICRLTIAANRRGDPQTIFPRRIGYRDNPFPRKCVYGVGHRLARWSGLS